MKLPDRERCWAECHLEMSKLATYRPPVVLVRRFKHRLCSAPFQAFHLVLYVGVHAFGGASWDK
jgi:hypothetical protein